MGLLDLIFGGGGRRRGGRNDEYREALREMRKQKSKLYRTVRTLVIFASVLSVALFIMSFFVEDLRHAWLYKGICIVFALCAGGCMALPWITEFERDRTKAAKGEAVVAWHKYVVFAAWGLIGVCSLLWIISVFVIGDGVVLKLIAEEAIEESDLHSTFIMLRSSLIVTLQVAVISVVAISFMRFGKNYVLLRGITYITLLYLDFWLSWFIGGVTVAGLTSGEFTPISNTFIWVVAVLMVIALIVASSIFGAQVRRKEIELFMKGDVETLTSGDVNLMDAETTSGRNERSGFGSRPASKPAEKSPEEQLQKIKDLLDKGIISEEEYQQKRKDIIDKM